jgi:chromosome partitioning protein
MIYTYYSKKGGVGKTTIIGEHASYLSTLGKRVALVSIDDQNSTFEMFGQSELVFGNDSNYIEFFLAGEKVLNDVALELRPNLFGFKTLNTDMISKKLTLERTFEKQFIQFFELLRKAYDIVFVDLPPSSNRANEVVFEIVDQLIVIVELNKLGVNGLFNTIQYFTDVELNMNKVKYVLPNGFSKIKSAPKIALDDLYLIVKENLKKAKVLDSFPEKSIILTLQQKGLSVFDTVSRELSPYHKKLKKEAIPIFQNLFQSISVK